MAGRRKLAFAGLAPGRRYEADPMLTTATPAGSGWTLNGSKLVVIGTPIADTLVVSARTASGASLFLVDRARADLSIRAYRIVDSQRAADVTLANVSVAAGALLGTDGGALPAIEEALDFATALACAVAVGGMKSANDATLDYFKTHTQFGTVIGSFQALQHSMADMFIACGFARSMAILAATGVDAAAGATDAAAMAERKCAVSQAMVCIADAAHLISQESVQLHGGMGMTEEMKVSHTFRRLTVLAQRFGDADHHLARLAALG